MHLQMTCKRYAESHPCVIYITQCICSIKGSKGAIALRAQFENAFAKRMATAGMRVLSGL
jgi:hypothetical protein